MSLTDKKSSTDQSNLRVRLTGSATKRTLSFNVTPDITENQTVNYKSMDPVHAPGQIWVYQNSQSRTFSIGNIKIVSRTMEEATKNLQMINVLRAWTKPQFGLGTLRQKTQTANVNSLAAQFNDINQLPLGSPPEVLLLSAYSNDTKRGNIYKVPVVITQLGIPFPSDVDYVLTDNGTPFPALMSMDLTLLETQSPKSLAEFSLFDYRNGKLTGF